MSEDTAAAFNPLAEFRTESLPLAGFLIVSKSLPLARIDVDPERHFGIFIFHDVAHRGPALETKFLSGEALVDANAFHHQLRTLRREIDARVHRNSGHIQTIGAIHNGRNRQR